VFQDFIDILMCPNTKEKLSLISRNELLEASKDICVKLPEGDQFLINESKSFLYQIAPYGFPILLPEEGIPLKIDPKAISSASSSSQKISFVTLKKHKDNLETVYRKDDYVNKPTGRKPWRDAYESSEIHTPAAENLIPGSVLDAGCGIGFFRRYTGGRFHLMFDLSQYNLSYNFAPNKVIGRTECIPIQDGSFENVVSLRSLQHCQDPKTSISELARCVKPGGRFLVAVWREDWPACLKGSPWAFTNFTYFIKKAFLLAKNNPSLFVDRALFKLKLKKTKKLEVAVFWDKDTQKVFSRRFNRDAFQKMLEDVGLKILKRGYCGIETPGSKVPKFLLKRFFDAEKYGLYCYFVCEKPL